MFVHKRRQVKYTRIYIMYVADSYYYLDIFNINILASRKGGRISGYQRSTL